MKEFRKMIKNRLVRMLTAGDISRGSRILLSLVFVSVILVFVLCDFRPVLFKEENRKPDYKNVYPIINNKTLKKILNPVQNTLPLLEGILSRGVPKSEAELTTSLSALNLIEDYLKIKEIKDLRQTANPNTSIVYLHDNRTRYKIGEEIRLRIELFDGWGRHLVTGGDLLRVWIIEPTSGANSSGYVVDHGNGSYTGIVKALWIGNPEIKISIAITKEHVGIILNQIKEHGLLYYLSGKFIKEKFEEDTKCTTIPKVKGYTEVCNLTNENFGMAWYCGKPKSTSLTCKDWTSYSGNRIDYLSELEKFLVSWHKHMNIARKFRIPVVGDVNRVPSKTIGCNKRPKRSTWYDTSPTGYFYKNHWHILECKYSFPVTKAKYIECLRGRPLIFLGDSTIRYWFVYLTQFLDLTFTVGRWDEIKDKAWQKYAHAERKDVNLSIVWAPHELPFYGGISYIKNLRSVGARLDEIGHNSTAIVILHWYLHMARASQEIYREHVRNARLAVDRLLTRSPKVELFIKGPHAITHTINLEPHDYLRRFQEQILFEEFQDIQDKVTYLSEWDMTVGSENVNVHPSKLTNLEMVRQLLSYACFRNG